MQAALKLPATGKAAVHPSNPAMLGSSSGLQLQDQAVQKSRDGPGSEQLTRIQLSGAELQQHRLHEAALLLVVALQVLVADGGSDPVATRAVVLELAAVWVQLGHSESGPAATSPAHESTAPATELAAARVAAALAVAHEAAGHACCLLLESHTLQPVVKPSSSFPVWLVELLRGQEELQASLQAQAAAAAAAAAAAGTPASKATSGVHSSSSSSAVGVVAAKPVPAAAGASGGDAAGTTSATAVVPDTTLARLSVCFFVQLVAGNRNAGGRQQQALATVQMLLVQPTLRAACVKFASSCCWQEVPQGIKGALMLSSNSRSRADQLATSSTTVPSPPSPGE